jgi:O-antigen/teichoic acid export membrane protein
MSVKSAVYNIAVKVFQLMAQVGLAYFTNRILAPEGRGLVAAASTWHMMLYTIGYVSIPIAVYNLFGNRKEQQSAFAGNALLAGLLLGILTSLAAWILFYLFPGWFENIPETFFILIIAGIPLYMIQQFHLSILQMMGHLKEYNFSFLLTTLLNIVLTGLAILMQQYNAYIAIWILLGNWALTLIYTSGMLWKYSTHAWRTDFSLLGKMLATGLVAHFASIVTLAAQRLDLIMVNNILGQREAGIYFLAIMLTGTLTIIPSAVQSVLYPRLAETGLAQGATLTFRVARLTFLIMLLACGALAILTWPAVRIVGGKSFMEAVPLIWIMLPGVALYSIPVVLAGLWNSMGIFKLLNITSILMFGFIIVADYSLISRFGLEGAAVAACSISIFAFMLHAVFVKIAAKANPFFELMPKLEDVKFLTNIALNALKKIRP